MSEVAIVNCLRSSAANPSKIDTTTISAHTPSITPVAPSRLIFLLSMKRWAR